MSLAKGSECTAFSVCYLELQDLDCESYPDDVRLSAIHFLATIPTVLVRLLSSYAIFLGLELAIRLSGIIPLPVAHFGVRGRH